MPTTGLLQAEVRRRRSVHLRRSGRPPIVFSTEIFEARVLLAAITWDGGGDGTTWADARNWSGDQLPSAADDVTVSSAAGATVQVAGTQAARSLATATPLRLTGGTFSIATTANISADFTLAGGTLAGATVATAAGAKLVAMNGTLDGVTVRGAFDVPPARSAVIRNGLTLDGATVTLGTAQTSNGVLSFQGGAQALAGVGEVYFAGTSANGISNSSSAALTIGPNITIRGRNGGISTGSTGASVVNRGTIRAEAAGGTVAITGTTFRNEGTLRAAGGGRLTVAGLTGDVGDVAVSDAGSSLRLDGAGYALDREITVATGNTMDLAGAWSNRSVIHLAGGTLNLVGTFATADVGTIDRPGGAGTINLTGTLRNTGATLALNAASGPWALGPNGTIQGGTIATADGVSFHAAGGTLDGVTLAGSMLVYSTQVRNGLTLTGAAVTIGDATRGGVVSFVGPAQAVSGAGEFVFAGPTNSFNNSTADTLTVGPGVTIRGRAGTVSIGGGAASIVNRGTIRADVAGATINVVGANFRNEGWLAATVGARLNVAGLAGNVGDVAVSGAGSALRLDGVGQVIDRDITVPAGTTLELAGTWSNRAAIHLAGGALSLQGDFATADLGTIDRPGGAGTVTIAGLLRNTGSTLALNAATGPWALGINGTIRGGTVATADGVSLLGHNATLDGVTLAGSMVVANSTAVQVRNGLTLDAATITLGGDTRTGGLSFFGPSQSLAGTGEVVFAGTGTNGLTNATAGSTLTIAPGVTLRGRGAAIANTAGPGSTTIVSHATLRADGAGGLIRVSGGTFSNRGTLAAAGGGQLQVENITGDAGGVSASGFGSVLKLAGTGYALDRHVSATSGAALTLAGSWSNRATVRVTDGTLNLDGTFTTAGMGAIRRSGGTVNLLGVLDNTGATLRLDAASGSWFVRGTVRGGRLVTADAARFLSALGRFERVTLAGEIELADLAYTATFVDGLEMEDAAVFVKGNASFPGRVFFNSAGAFDLSGTGQFLYAATGSNSFTYTAASLTIGRGVTFRGGGVLFGSNSTSPVLMLGTIVSEVPGSFFLGATGGTFTNRGTLRALNGAGMRFDGPLALDEGGTLAVSPGSFVQLLGHLGGTAGDPAAHQQLGTMLLTGGGNADNPVLFEAMSRDVGAADPATRTGRNFHYSVLNVRTRYARLVDRSDNAPGDGAEAVYADNVHVAETSTLDLNGLHLYARRARVQGTVVNGTITLLPGETTLTPGVPSTGTIAVPREVDAWQFFGRAGDSVAVEVNVGSVTDPLFSGTLWADVEIRDAADRVVAKATATSSTGPTMLRDVVLPADGAYRVLVRAAASQPNSTGSYLVTLYQAPGVAWPLSLDALTASRLATPVSVDRWTFHGRAGQAVRLDVLAPNPSARYTLTGPTGTTFFADLADDSDVAVLDRDGDYSLTVRSRAFEVPYSLVMRGVGEDALSLGVPFQSSASRPGDARLFRLRVPTAGPLLLRLDAPPSAGDRFELHARFGTSPSRGVTDFKSAHAVADGGLLVPYAAAGDWYVLVYSASVGSAPPPPRTYTLLASRPDVTLSGVSPSRAGNVGAATLTVTGAGFGPGTTVSLVGDGGATFAASSTEVDSATAVSAAFDLRLLPPGAYDVRVDSSPGASATLPAAFTVVAAGAPRLETRLQMPAVFGRHATATIYVHYANAGDAPMPAPLLLLESTDPDNSDKPLLTLDSRRVVEGFWSASLPEGFGHTVQFLASGRTPGVLLPGESATVPVYYIGLLAPWNFNDVNVELGLRVFEPSDATPIDWAALKSARPPQFDAEIWGPLSDSLRAIVGETWGGYVAMLDAQATALARHGETVNDVGQLWSFALRRANGLAPVGTLEDAVDAALPTPGIALSFGRTFASTLSARHQAGPLGRGWWTPWQARLSVRPDGAVVIAGRDNAQRRFQPDTRRPGAYFSLSNDQGRLSPVQGGAFLLREAGGTVSAFRPDGRPDYVQDPNGNRVTAAYDAAGRLTALTHSAGQSLALAYNDAGLIASVTDSAGRATTYAYDAANQHLVSVRWFDGRVTHYEYAGAGAGATAHALLSVRRPDDSVRHFTYDARGRLGGTYVNDHVGEVTFAEEGATGVRVTDAAGASSRLFFNQFGLPSRLVDATGHFANAAYDAALEVSRVTDAAGQPTAFRHDAAGNLTQTTDAMGLPTQFRYAGPFNRLTGLVDAAGNPTRYEYDARGNLVAVAYADGSTSRAAYDARGNLISATNRRGQTVHYAYNDSGQVTRVTLPGGAQLNYAYDARGNLLTAADASGATGFTYDPGDRLTKVSYPNGRFVAYAYDAAGRRASVTDHTGFSVNYAYDAAGRLARLGAGDGALISSFAYDPTGRLARRDNGNGTYTTFGYDPAGRVTRMINHAPGGGANSRFEYAYDVLGRPAAVATLDGAWAYTYDPLGQLTRAVFTSTNASIPSQDLRYAYDATGNRTGATVNGVAADYDADALNRYTNVGGVPFSYDADGNLVAEGDTAYAYDAFGRLTSVVTPSGTWAYEYDALGNRTAASHDGRRTEYVLDPTGMRNVLAEYDGAGGLVAHYTHGGGLASRVAAGGASTYYDYDLVGSTAGLSDASGAYVNRYAYRPFGEEIHSSESVANPFEFNGRFGVRDDGGGLLYMRSRNYDPGEGRFTSADKVGLRGGDVNLYRYVWNAPTWFVDPLGLWGADTSNYPDMTGGADDPGLDVSAGDITIFNADGSETVIHPDGSSITTGVGDIEIQNADGSETIIHPDGTSLTVGAGEIEIILSGPEEVGGGGPGSGGPGGGGAGGGSPGPGGPGGPAPAPPGGSAGANGGSGTAASSDPNAKTGPAGFGPLALVAPGALLPYRIDFENDAQASAPAQEVRVDDRLDPNFDFASFALTEVGFGDTLIAVPAGSQYFHAVVPMTFNGRTFDVWIEAGIDLATGRVFARFQSIDPETSLPPDVLTGFLPPEDGTGRGMGHVSYTVRSRAGLADGTELRNVATIIFDINPPINTDQVDPHDPAKGIDPAKQARVTIDAAKPVVAQVLVSSTKWKPAFLAYLKSAGLGDGGFALPQPDAGKPIILPWINLDQVKVRFGEDVDVTEGHLALYGRGATPGVVKFEYDPETRTATWTFARPMNSDAMTVQLSSAITDRVGNAMAAVYSTALRVLTGDANRDGRLGASDVLLVRSRLSRTTTSGGFYTAFGDLDGDGRISAIDLAVLRGKLSQPQPAVQAAQVPSRPVLRGNYA